MENSEGVFLERVTDMQQDQGIGLAAVGLDAETCDQVRLAAQQAQVEFVSEIPDYSLLNLEGQMATLAKSADELVCLIDFDKNTAMAAKTAAGLQSSSGGHTRLIALSAETHPEVILQAMRAGCTEFLTKPVVVEALAELLRKLRERWLASVKSSSRPPGRVLAFLGVRGGAGATTIAVHLGSLLAQRRKTLIMDQHPCLGHVGLSFGLDEPSCNLYGLLQNISRLDAMLLKSYVTHHCSGADVLPSPGTLSDPARIEAGSLGNAIRFVSSVYDFVLIDCQSGLDEWNQVTAGCCDELWLVATPDVPALHDLARYLDRLRELQFAPSKLKVVINQYGSGRSVTIAQIENAIDHPVGYALPVDTANLTRALDAGQPISSEQRSEFGSRIRKWAADLAPVTVQPVAAKHRFAFWN